MSQKGPLGFGAYLESLAVDPNVLRWWLNEPSWMRFDPELGYVLSSSMPIEGIDGSGTITTVGAHGGRRTIMHAELSPRINTYGNSFTHCQQVSDGETWQEYLAGHLGEPVANFGVGGYGVYQAYRRMLREEQSDHAADFVVLYIWGNDSLRSVTRCFRAFVGPRMDTLYAGREGPMFHGNPWSCIEWDLDAERFVERPNPLPDEDAVLAMSDPQWMRDHLCDDLALELCAFAEGRTAGLGRERIDALAAGMGVAFDWGRDERGLREQAASLLHRYGNRATVHILGEAKAFVERQGKRLLVVVNDGGYLALSQLLAGERRFDQDVVDFLRRDGFDVFDMTSVDHEDLQEAGLSWERHKRQVYVNGRGHYSPAGNHRFAYAIKNTVVDWLDPKPVTYRQRGADIVDYEAYMKRV